MRQVSEAGGRGQRWRLSGIMLEDQAAALRHWLRSELAKSQCRLAELFETVMPAKVAA